MTAPDMEYCPFELGESQLGQIVAVTGTLLADEEGIRVELSGRVGSTIISVNHPGLLEILFAEVPAWVGGPHYYNDEAVAIGRLSKCGETGIELVDLVSLQILRDDESFRISWPRAGVPSARPPGSGGLKSGPI